MRRPRGLTLVEVLVAAGILLVVATSLLESVGYARRYGGVIRHRAAASAAAGDAMEGALSLGYSGLPTGVTSATVALEAGVPCTVTTTVTTETGFANVQGLRRVAVQAAWSEPLLPGRPTESLRLDSYVGDPIP